MDKKRPENHGSEAQRRAEDSIKKFNKGVDWFRHEAFSRSYGRVELAMAIHDGEIKTVYRGIKEHMEDDFEDIEGDE